MAQLDNSLAGLAHSAPPWVVLGVALLLGLRHATDPDHLAAVTTLIAGDRHEGPRAASRLGLAWGLGHAVTLFTFGVPVILLRPYLPSTVQRGAEAVVGLVVVVLGARLLRRWREGGLYIHEHEHAGDVRHTHRHAHPSKRRTDHPHRHALRSTRGAFAIGLLHGFGGSAGVAVLVLASIRSREVATGALAVLAIGAALSMTALSTWFGLVLVRFPVRLMLDRAVPVLGIFSLCFGAWYGLIALRLISFSF